MRVLCGDIGGTHSRLLLAEVEAARVDTLLEQDYPSANFSSFDQVLEQFMTQLDSPPASACFAVAGPVESGRATFTNLPWRIDAEQLKQRFSLPAVALINDFSAVASGIDALDQRDFRILQQGHADLDAPIDAPRTILGAGTGLGMAQSVYQQGRWQVLPSQGGHAGFSPANAWQRGLLDWLSREQDRVSNEDLLSGPGLVTLYRYAASRAGQGDHQSTRDLLAADDPAATISERAMTGDDSVAVTALNAFVQIYAAVAGDLALYSLAFGGVYLAGGIAPRIAEFLDTPTFLQVFHSKGPMSELMGRFPIRIVMNPRVGLMGAALCARDFAG